MTSTIQPTPAQAPGTASDAGTVSATVPVLVEVRDSSDGTPQAVRINTARAPQPSDTFFVTGVGVVPAAERDAVLAHLPAGSWQPGRWRTRG